MTVTSDDILKGLESKIGRCNDDEVVFKEKPTDVSRYDLSIWAAARATVW